MWHRQLTRHVNDVSAFLRSQETPGNKTDNCFDKAPPNTCSVQCKGRKAGSHGEAEPLTRDGNRNSHKNSRWRCMKRPRRKCRRIRRCSTVLERLVVDAPTAICFSVTEIGRCKNRNFQVELFKLATTVEMLEKCGAYA